MITYSIEVSICWLLFYAIYSLLLSKETFFHINRFYLLVTLVLGLVIPLFTIDFLTFFYQKPVNSITYLAKGFSELELVIEDSVEQAPTIGFPWLTIVLIIYIVGFLIAFSKMLHGFRQIYILYKEGVLTKKGKYNLVLTDTPHLPFSFFNYLFWNKDTALVEQDSGKIITHELAHINQWHSVDALLLEVLSIALWFSPPIYWYKKSLRTIHEYLADAYVLRNTKKKQYGHLLIRQVQSGMQISLANNFIHSQLKQRIKMMTRNKSRRKELMRYLPALPLLLLMILVFSNKNVRKNFGGGTVKAGLTLEEKLENTFDEKITNVKDSLPSDISSKIEKVIFEIKGGQEKKSQIPTHMNNGEKIFKVVEKMPLFPGCEGEYTVEKKTCADQKMLTFIYENIKYPEIAKKERLSGTVVIRFLVKKDGTIEDVEILRNIGGGTGEEALRVVNLMKEKEIKWIPGEKDGEMVNVNFNLPIKFKLADDKEVRSGEMTEDFKDKVILKDGEIYTGDDKDISKTELTEMHLIQKKDIIADEKTSDGDKIYKVVQQMPLFPGCDEEEYSEELRNCANQKMLAFIYNNIKYPKAAHKAGTEGTVVIRFLVKKDGSIDETKILRNVGNGTGEEALRVVNLMKENKIKWSPGKQDGEEVNVYFNLPIKFKLAGKVKEENNQKEEAKKPKDLLKRGLSAEDLKLNLSGNNITLNAFPNPVEDQLTITLEGTAKNFLVTVFDVNGKEYFRDNVKTFSGTYYKTINLINAAKGTLIVNIRHMGKDYQKKIVVQ